MSFVRIKGKEYLICHRPILVKHRVKSGRYMDNDFRDWWIVKYNSGSGTLDLGNCVFPIDMVGKRVKIIVEEIKEGK